MRIRDMESFRSGTAKASGYDLEASYILRKKTPSEQRDEALQKVGEAHEANARTTFDMMDRHTEMVKKSQELSKVKARKNAIERQSRESREEHSLLLAEMALKNAERSDRLKTARLEDLL